VDALSLKVFKARLEGALAQPKLVPDLVVGNPAMAVELELDDLWGPFQPKPFYDSLFFFFL